MCDAASIVCQVDQARPSKQVFTLARDRIPTLMPYMPQEAQFALLPESRPPWTQFVLSMGAQSLAAVGLAWLAVLHPAVLRPPAHDYDFVRLVSSPTFINHQPAPVSVLQEPHVVTRLAVPEDLQLPVERPKPKSESEIDPPRLQAEGRQLALPAAAPVVPRALLKTDVFSTGSSATPTIARAPQRVQTGGFGDPNGLPALPTNVRPITIAKSGSFDLPSGPASGNGAGGTQGVRGVVASAGFGNGMATGDGSGNQSASSGTGTVRRGGFGDANAPVPASVHSKAAEDAAKTLPAEILSKPTPDYTEEARRAKKQGPCILWLIVDSTGHPRDLRVIRGLGFGLDAKALEAVKQWRFQPALKDGRPVDVQISVEVEFHLY